MKYLQPWEIVYLHHRILKHYGGLLVPLSPEMQLFVEGLCANILQICQYERVESVYELAAIYWKSLAFGHIFSDGNKRTAINAAYLVLHRNGIATQVPDDLVERVILCARAKITKSNLIGYIEEKICQKPEPAKLRSPTSLMNG